MTDTNDLISRQAAIEAIESHLRVGDEVYPLTRTDKILNHAFEIAASCVYNLPTAEKVGKWITKHPYRDDFGKGVRLDLRFHFPSCSNCGAVFGQTPYYCPNCGSKMNNGTEWLDWDAGYGVQEGEE